MSAAVRDAWLAGPEGRLCGREQAKAWALREVWRAEGKPAHGMLPFVSARVKKTKRGKPGREAPTRPAMQQFFKKVDAGPEWYPGKSSGQKRGCERVLRGAKRTAIVAAAKRLKAEVVSAARPRRARVHARAPGPDANAPLHGSLAQTRMPHCMAR